MYRRRGRSTPAGAHRPAMLDEVLAALDPQPGAVAVDCTLGDAGHAVELLRRVGPTGILIAFDLDPAHLPACREKLAAIAPSFSLHHGNFAGLSAVLAADGLAGCDFLLADLGMSSMQVDDPQRGFSFTRDGPLDMRMDPSRGRSAAELPNTPTAEDLVAAFSEPGDEPEADARAPANARPPRPGAGGSPDRDRNCPPPAGEAAGEDARANGTGIGSGPRRGQSASPQRRSHSSTTAHSPNCARLPGPPDPGEPRTRQPAGTPPGLAQEPPAGRPGGDYEFSQRGRPASQVSVQRRAASGGLREHQRRPGAADIRRAVRQPAGPVREAALGPAGEIAVHWPSINHTTSLSLRR